MRALLLAAVAFGADETARVRACGERSGCTACEDHGEACAQRRRACVAAECLGTEELARLHRAWARHFGAPAGPPPEAFRRSVLEAAVGAWEDGAEHTYWYGFAATPTHELFPTQVPLATREPLTAVPGMDALPTEWDWRAKGFTLPVQDQYRNHTTRCGSCWAFAATGAMAAQHWRAGSPQAPPTLLSVQQLLDCDRNPEKYPVRSNSGCGGGFANVAFKDLAANGTALAADTDYPYAGTDEPCREVAGLPWSRVVSHEEVSGEDAIAAALVQYGPVAASLDALAMTHYRSGIQDPWFWQCSGANLNHAVLIVGFGEENGKRYWLIQNSWGEQWGEAGFYRLVRGKRACGIDQLGLTPRLVGAASLVV